MPRRLLALLAAAACGPLTGSFAVQAARPVDVVVKHADTGEPAAGVEVTSFRYYWTGMLRCTPLNEPSLVDGTTDADGRATLRLCDRATGEVTGTQLRVEDDNWEVPAETVRRGGRLDERARGPGAYHVELVARRRWLVQHLACFDPWRGARSETLWW